MRGIPVERRKTMGGIMGLSAKTCVLGAVLTMAAVILLPRAVLADDFETPSVEEAKISSGAPGGTARLRGFDVTFDFNSRDNSIGYSWQCKGLDFPARKWPENCSVTFDGPAITKRFGMCGGVALDCSPGCVLKDRSRAVLADDFERHSVEEAKISSGAPGGTARLRGFDVTFDFNSRDNSIGYSWQCKGLDFPARKWPENCSVTFDGPAINERYGMCGAVALDCSPGCVLKDRYGREFGER